MMKLSTWLFAGMMFGLYLFATKGNIGAGIGTGLLGIAIAINERGEE